MTPEPDSSSVTCPVFALTSTVLFPHDVRSVELRLPQNVSALGELKAETDEVLVVPVRKTDTETWTADDLMPMGVLASLLNRLQIDEGRYEVVLRGRRRARVTRVVQETPHLLAEVEVPPLPETEADDPLVEVALDAFASLVDADPQLPKELLRLLRLNRDDLNRFTDRLILFGPFTYEERAELLQELDTRTRLSAAAEAVHHEVRRVRVGRQIEEKVQADFEEKQKRTVLRARLAAIREALGEVSSLEGQAERLLERATERGLDGVVRRRVERGTERLRQLPSSSPEVEVLARRLERILDLPWGRVSEDAIRPKRVRKRLEQGVVGQDRVRTEVVEALAAWRRTGRSGPPHLCLCGPPGTGKASLARLVAEATGRPFVSIALDRTLDPSGLVGVPAEHPGSRPGELARGLIRAGVLDPVVCFENLDGIPSYSVVGCLAQLLADTSGVDVEDRYLDVPLPLERAFLVFTARHPLEVPELLREHLHLVEVLGYTVEEKLEIAREHLIPEALGRVGLEEEDVSFETPALERLATEYTRETGVHDLARLIDSLSRKAAARRMFRRGKKQVRIRDSSLERLLGPAAHPPDDGRRTGEVGVATGLAWTRRGGELLEIETLRMVGEGRLISTGHLGEVMSESVRTGYSYVRSRAERYDIDPDALKELDIHVHFPAGAVPKDGPSAGIAIVMALISLLTGRPLRHDMAMTGEVSLRGDVLPVGGIREKVMAAHRAGIDTVILSAENANALTDIPKSVRKTVDIQFVKRVDEVVERALSDIVLAGHGAIKLPEKPD